MNKKLTPEEAKRLKPTLDKLGIKFITVYKNKCILCGKKFTSKNEKKLAERLKKHVDEKCSTARWMRGAFEILRLAGLKKVINADLIYLQDGKFPEGCERTKHKELEILNNVKDLIDNWGKEEKE